MTTLTQMVAARRHPLVVRWELVTGADGRTRPHMRWEQSAQTTSQDVSSGHAKLAA